MTSEYPRKKDRPLSTPILIKSGILAAIIEWRRLTKPSNKNNQTNSNDCNKYLRRDLLVRFRYYIASKGFYWLRKFLTLIIEG